MSAPQMQLAFDLVNGPAAIRVAEPSGDQAEAVELVARLAPLVSADLRAYAFEDVARVLAEAANPISWYVVALNVRIVPDRGGVHLAAARVALADLEAAGRARLVHVDGDDGTPLGYRWEAIA